MSLRSKKRRRHERDPLREVRGREAREAARMLLPPPSEGRRAIFEWFNREIAAFAKKAFLPMADARPLATLRRALDGVVLPEGTVIGVDHGSDDATVVVRCRRRPDDLIIIDSIEELDDER